MINLNRIKLTILWLSIALGLTLLLMNDKQQATARSAGPDAGFTSAPGELNCDDCHVPDSMGGPSGQFSVTAPPAYIPGQTYEITVHHTNSDASRRRWGFQLTALDENNQKAGTLEPLDALTQTLNNQGPFPNRQYIEHTSSGTFFGQQGGASWTFRWTAPPTDVGTVSLYTAGNQANGDGNTSGDRIFFTFISISPTTASPDFNLAVTPSSQTVTPGHSATYTVTLTPTAGFTGPVALSASGLPAGTSASFNPASINVTDASAQSSTLTITTTGGTPTGTSSLNITGTSGSLTHAAPATLNVVSPASADLAIVKTDSPDPALAGSNLTYRVAVTNLGPANATNVNVADTLPSGVTFVSATPSQGTCSGTSAINCALGNLNVNASATVVIVVTPTITGAISNTASVNATESDPFASNNTATAITSVEAAGAGPRMLVPELGVREVTAGLDTPTSLAFLGANDLFVLEKGTGKVKRIVNGQAPGTVLDLAVNNASERGLLGIALHPNFAANGFVYLYWTWRGGNNGSGLLGADTSDIALVDLRGNRVDRFVWNGTSLTFDRNIISLRALQSDDNQPLRGNHNGGVLRFGPDGKLYVLVGDVGRRGLLQNITNSTTPDDSFGGPAPDDNHLTGVILRLNDDGTTPTDNPFFNVNAGGPPEAVANVKKIFAYGLRNGFGMAFDPLSGNLWTQENGDDAFDEINRVAAGFNGGWIQLMGPSSRIAEYRAIEISRAGGLQQLRWPPTLIADTPAQALQRLYDLPGAQYTEPQFSWRYAVAPSPIGFVRGRALGMQYEGDLFVGASRTTLVGGYLFHFELSSDRQSLTTTDVRLQDRVADNDDKFDITESESLLIGRDFGITTDIQTGPDGNLYVVSLSNGAIYQIFAQPRLFVARLDGAQEVPSNNSTATGVGTVSLSPDETTAKVSLTFSGLAGAQTAAEIHGPGAPGVNASVLFTLPGGSFNDFQITLTPAQAADLKTGLLYFNVRSSAFPGGEIRGQIGATPTAAPSIVEFSAATYNVNENDGTATITVHRFGETSEAATVDFTTQNLSASDLRDYTLALGTLRFAPHEHSKTFNVFITDDLFVEGRETLRLILRNPTGATTPGTHVNATLNINDDDTVAPTTNPVEEAEFFVRQHYIDFLNRAPDASGFAFWVNQITECGNDVGCREVRRINVSAAFFLSIEFQQTGYLVYRFYQAAFDTGERLRRTSFLPDTQQIGHGVIVGQGNWEQQLEQNKETFAHEFVTRREFLARYPLTMTPAQFVDALNTNTGGSLSTAERDRLVSELTANHTNAGRASVLRQVAEDEDFARREFNRAFVLMEYFGYLQRNPDDRPDTDFSGYNFWLNKLNEFGGDFIRAELVKAFILSDEYRKRFGP